MESPVTMCVASRLPGRDYWSKRLNLSAAQRHRIEVSCLQINHRGRGDMALSEDVVNK
jgi:hypothetical protein